MSSTRMIRAVLLVEAAAVLAAAAALLRDKRQTAELTVDDIHEQLDALESGHPGSGYRQADLR